MATTSNQQKSPLKPKVAILTSGGLAPCLSSAVGYLIETYTRTDPSIEIICYLNGYRGLLLGDSIRVTETIREQAPKLQHLGGSPIGNSRVRLKNANDCARRGLVKNGESPERVAALRLISDKITILHTIGGDDTNMSAGDLSLFLRKNFDDYKLSVIGLPKTIDNDVRPVAQTLGAQTAAEQGALFFSNVVSELSSNPRMLIVHEIMGRNSGWLGAKTALIYRERNRHAFPALIERGKSDVHAVYLPEMAFDVEAEVERLSAVMKRFGCVNVFLSEGACSQAIVAELEGRGEKVEKDAFGHVRLDTLNPGKWFSEVISKRIGAEKVLVQKSGYFCRAAPANDYDRRLVRMCAEKAVEFALEGRTGLSGPDEEDGDRIGCIDYSRVSGGKCFDLRKPWFAQMMHEIAQPVVSAATGQNEPFFRYEPSDTPTSPGDQRNIDRGLHRTSRLVSVATVALLSVSSDESDAVQRLLHAAPQTQRDVGAGLAEVLFALMTCFKNVSSSLKDVDCEDGAASFKRMANSLFEESLRSVDSVATLSSLDNETPLSLNQTQNGFDVFLDPADGSSNIDANISIGSIFAVQLRGELLLSGYCLYSSATILMLTLGSGVYGFTLNPSNNEFKLSHQKLRIPADGKFYSANEGYASQWRGGLVDFLSQLKAEKKVLRYTGTLVADAHRTLLYGGIFFYPENDKFPQGKLKLSSEAQPIGHLLEQAGGVAVDTEGRRVLAKSAEAINQRTALAFGSRGLVERLVQCSKSA